MPFSPYLDSKLQRNTTKSERECESALIYENFVNNMVWHVLEFIGMDALKRLCVTIQLCARGSARFCAYWTNFTLEKFLENSSLFYYCICIFYTALLYMYILHSDSINVWTCSANIMCKLWVCARAQSSNRQINMDVAA